MEEDSGMLMWSVVKSSHVWAGRGEKGEMGLDKRTKNRAVDSEHGASMGRGSQLRTKSHQSKQEGYSLSEIFINTTHTRIFYVPYCALKNYILSSAG